MKKPGFLRSFRTPILLAFLTFSIFSCSLFVDSPKNGGNGHGSTQEEIDPGKKYLTRIYFIFPGDDERLVIRPNLSGSDILTRLNVDKIRLNYTIDGTDYSKTFDYDAGLTP